MLDERFKAFISRWARRRDHEEQVTAQISSSRELTDAELDEKAQAMSTESLKMSVDAANQRWEKQEFDDTAASTMRGHRLIRHMNAWKRELARRGESVE